MAVAVFCQHPTMSLCGGRRQMVTLRYDARTNLYYVVMLRLCACLCDCVKIVCVRVRVYACAFMCMRVRMYD